MPSQTVCAWVMGIPQVAAVAVEIFHHKNNWGTKQEMERETQADWQTYKRVLASNTEEEEVQDMKRMRRKDRKWAKTLSTDGSQRGRLSYFHLIRRRPSSCTSSTEWMTPSKGSKANWLLNRIYYKKEWMIIIISRSSEQRLQADNSQ